MSPAVTIRPARGEDLPTLEQIHRVVRAEISSPPTSFADDTADELILVAEVGGAVVGFAGIYVRDHFLHHLYVGQASRGKGVGTALLEAATRELSVRPWLKVEASNTAARGFYRARGWREDPPEDGVVCVRGPA